MYSNEDNSSINHILTHDEKILEILLLILTANENCESELIPCLQSLIKVHSPNSNHPVIRNKLINAITFIIKSIATNDEESLKIMFPNHQINNKRSCLMLIGTLRLLLKSNRPLMKYILKGLVSREESTDK